MQRYLNKKVNIFSLFIFYCLTTMILVGCASMQKANEAKEMGYLEPSTIFKFPDIPIPAGFVNLAKSTYAFQNNNFRVGLLRYTGKGTADQVANFYKEQMPIYKWNLINMAEFGGRVLNFEKETETCIVDIETRGSKCDLFISLGPRSQGASKRTQEKVVK